MVLAYERAQTSKGKKELQDPRIKKEVSYCDKQCRPLHFPRWPTLFIAMKNLVLIIILSANQQFATAFISRFHSEQ